ncbi:MAG: class I SAM-dependent methyltransferase [Lachnospiraceae bacterium]|nr:class I SAM-dependent methyltransferase [Lachnospiraceae bacterium]
MNEQIFTGVGEIYAKYRPTYPAALIQYLSEDVGLNVNSIVADIGSGTGILTNILLSKCAKVYAVEPNADMRQIAEINNRGVKNFISINSNAENTTLKEHSVDYITAAQSFHWFNRLSFKKECQRILKPGGKVILIWNCRDETSELVQDIDFISQKYCPLFSGSSGGMRGAKTENAYQDFFTGNYDTKIFANDILFDKERFIGLHQSASYRLNEDDVNYHKYIYALSEFFDSHCTNNELILPNHTCCYVGTV